MKEDIFLKIRNLIEKKEINKAQQELLKLHTKYKKDPNYLLLRSKIFYINKLYYLAIDTLFIALEFSFKFYAKVSWPIHCTKTP